MSCIAVCWGYEETWGFGIKLVQFWHTWHRLCPVVKGDLLIQTRHSDNWGSSWRGLVSLRCRLYHLQSCVCVTLLITIIVRVIISPIVTRVGVCVGGLCTWVTISISDLVKKRNGSLFSIPVRGSVASEQCGVCGMQQIMTSNFYNSGSRTTGKFNLHFVNLFHW